MTYLGAALVSQSITRRTVLTCACGRRWSALASLGADQQGIQEVEGEDSLRLFRCECGSTLSFPVTPTDVLR